MLNQAFLFCYIFCVSICFFCVLNTITPARSVRRTRARQQHDARVVVGLDVQEAVLALVVGGLGGVRRLQAPEIGQISVLLVEDEVAVGVLDEPNVRHLVARELAGLGEVVEDSGGAQAHAILIDLLERVHLGQHGRWST